MSGYLHRIHKVYHGGFVWLPNDISPDTPRRVWTATYPEFSRDTTQSLSGYLPRIHQVHHGEFLRQGLGELLCQKDQVVMEIAVVGVEDSDLFTGFFYYIGMTVSNYKQIKLSLDKSTTLQ